MSLKFTILGCGSSLGIPRIDGYYGNCDPNNKKNVRSRCSALIRSKNLNILIDTSPDLKSQLLANKIKNIDKVFYTHAHADQTHGINELRVFSLKNRKKIPIYADLITKRSLINTFGYCFEDYKNYPSILDAKTLKNKHILNDINSIMAGAACGVATMGNPVVAAACAGAVGGGIGGSILEDNKRRKKRYRQRRAEEHKRRCRVLSGDENPSHTNNPIFNGYESLSSPCKEFRKKNCTETSSGTCNTLKTQCRLARSCIFYDKHLS